MPLEEKTAPTAAAFADCDPLDEATVNPLIENAAKAQSLDSKLLRAVIDQESGFRPCAVSVKGAQGLMQLMPETAAEMGVADPFDPKQNVDGGARYLKQLIDKYKGDLPQALGAYNAGPKTVDQNAGALDVQETREYVDAVLAKAGLQHPDPAAKREDAAAQPVGAAAKPAEPPAKSPEAPVKPAEPGAKPANTPAQPVSPAPPSPDTHPPE
jgi:membrane-bound lytic murein transglycosylase B